MHRQEIADVLVRSPKTIRIFIMQQMFSRSNTLVHIYVNFESLLTAGLVPGCYQ